MSCLLSPVCARFLPRFEGGTRANIIEQICITTASFQKADDCESSSVGALEDERESAPRQPYKSRLEFDDESRRGVGEQLHRQSPGLERH